MNKTRDIIYFVPVYIGSLKYYSKLVLALEKEGYDVRFLIVRAKDARRARMETYCRENRLSFDIIEDGLNKNVFRIPFLTPIIKRWAHMRACRALLKRTMPAKLIVTKNIPPHRVIVQEANLLGIETIILQWAFVGPDHLHAHGMIGDETRARRLYYRIVDFLHRVLEFVARGPGYAAAASPKKFGVIDENARKFFSDRYGLDISFPQVVGMADFQIARELKERAETSTEFKRMLQGKYRIVPGRPVILVMSRWFHRAKINPFTIDEQVAHFYDILRVVRDVFPANEANVLFKLHPSEEDIYQSYKELDVAVLGDGASTDELVCLADLYISDPLTSANFAALASGVEAIFVNFSHFANLNQAAPFYRIKQTVTDKRTFRDLLKKFKLGKLERQYDNSHIDTHSIDRIVEMIKSG